MSYWADRSVQLQQAQKNKSEDYYRNLEKQYTRAMQQTQEKINAWYTRYATENGITLTEAKKQLNGRELAEFRMTVQEYIEKGQDLNNDWSQQLEKASAKVHITRLESLKLQMQQQVENVMGYEVDSLDKHLKRLYTDGYYRTAFNIQTGSSVGYDLMSLDTNKIDKVLAKPWAADGKNFSERIWGDHRAKLINTLNNDLTNCIITGENPKKLINQIAKEYDVSKAAAKRLVMTESAYISSVSTLDSYKESGVDEFEIVSRLDVGVCEKCGKLDGKHFQLKDYEVGVTAPPFHAHCYCTTTPYYDDMDDITTRAARNSKESKTYYIDKNIQFEDWKAAFVDGGTKKGLKTVEKMSFNESIENIRNEYLILRQSLTNNQKSLDDLNKQIKDTTAMDNDLQKQRNDAINEYGKYAKYENTDIDTAIKNGEYLKADLNKKIEKLEAQNSTYYNRPDRKTPEYDEWKKVTKDMDIDDVLDNLVNSKIELQNINKELQDLYDIKSGKIDIKALKKSIDDIAKQLSDNNTLRTALNANIKALNDDITNTMAKIETVVKKAGNKVIDEINATSVKDRADKLKELEEIKNELYQKYRIRKIEFSEYIKYSDEYWEYKGALPFKNAQDVKDIISQVRDCGVGKNDIKVHLNKSRSPVVKSIQQAYDYYPTEWVDKSVAKGTIKPIKKSRGYYSEWDKEIAISGNDIKDQIETAIHELGHRFERAVPEILDAEKVFYNRRTEGEALQWLGRGYRKDEKSRFDDFINKYMGKDYGGSAYELVSMGFQYGYADPTKLMQDKDFAEFIYGLLCLY